MASEMEKKIDLLVGKLTDDYQEGKVIDKIKVNTGPDQFEVVGDTLYVATYNTAYTFAIEK